MRAAFSPRSSLVPILVFFLVLNVVPLFWLLGVSFYRYKSTAARPAQYVGFDNFIDIWKSSEIWGLLGRTLSFMVLTVGGATILGMVLGFSSGVVGGCLGGDGFDMLFTPMVLPPVAVAYLLPPDLRSDFRHPQFLGRESAGQRFDFLTTRIWRSGRP